MPDTTKRILLDENLPVGLRKLLPGHDVWSASAMDLSGTSNGELVAEAERAGFDILLTADKNMRYQQNFSERHIAIVVLGSPRLPAIRENIEAVRYAVVSCERGAFIELGFRQ